MAPRGKRKTASSQAARVIRGCIIFHNIFIALSDDVPISETDPDENESSTEKDQEQANLAELLDGERAKLKRNIVKVYLSSIKNQN